MFDGEGGDRGGGKGLIGVRGRGKMGDSGIR